MKNDNSTNNFQYSYVKIEEVASNIDEYIIPECQEACKTLWSKNLFTFMCSNRENGDSKYILMNQVSPENEKIFKRLIKTDPQHYFFSSYRGTYGIRTHGEPNKAAQELVNLASPFEIQDVLEGYMPIKNFLMQKFDISKSVSNPDFKENIAEPRMEDFDDVMDFLNAYDKYTEQITQPHSIEVFDETKMTKTIEQYLEEAGVLELYDSEREVVYDSDFYKNAHLRYLEYTKQRKRNTPLEKREAELKRLEEEEAELMDIEELMDKQGRDIGDE